jgi:hypothetical protein
MQTLFNRRLYLLAPLAVLLYTAIYGACTPGSDMTVSESDVVVTEYDTEFDFGSVKYYAMPDSVAALMLSPSYQVNPLLSPEQEQDIISLVRSNFSDRGYVRVDTNNTVTPPQFAVVVSAQVVSYWDLYSFRAWRPWGWWGWYWWFYPPTVEVEYSFSSGTIFVQMGEFAVLVPLVIEHKQAYWMGSQNGVLDDSSANVERRFSDGINQMFEQSPYLKTDL